MQLIGTGKKLKLPENGAFKSENSIFDTSKFENDQMTSISSGGGMRGGKRRNVSKGLKG